MRQELTTLKADAALTRLEFALVAGRGGFEGIRDLEPTKIPETISDEALGAAIRAAIEISRAPWKR